MPPPKEEPRSVITRQPTSSRIKISIPTVNDLKDAGQGLLDAGEDILNTGGDVVTDIAETVVDTAQGAFDPENWKGWGEQATAMAEMFGIANPEDAPDWMRDRFEAGADAYYAGQEKVETTINEGVGNFNENTADVLEDNNDTLSALETKTNENVGDIVTDFETGLEQNTDTLTDMEKTTNEGIANANTALDNAGAVLRDTAVIVGEGIDAVIGPGDSMANNPQEFWNNNLSGIRSGKGKQFYDIATGKDDGIETMADVIGGFGETLYDEAGAVLGGGFQAGMEGVEMMGQSLNEQLMSMQRDKISGDPFGEQGKTRRLIQQQRTFQNQAPSLINRASPVQYG